MRLRTRFLNRKVYKFYFVISDIIKIQVGCMPVLVRIPQNYSHSLYSLCVFVYVISTVYLFFSVFVHFPFLTDGAAESHGGDVEIFCPLFLDVRARKRGRSQGFLRLISWSSTRDG